jgi:hypothetical protein
MLKKTAFACTLLFVFAFSFGFAFTMASSAKAECGNCCVYEWCLGHEGEIVGAYGHWIDDPNRPASNVVGGGDQICVNTGEGNCCDIVYLCPPVP